MAKKDAFPVFDKRMLELIKILKSSEIIRFSQEFCDAIELEKQNLVNIKKSHQHFTLNHIRLACKVYKVNANWIFGLSKEIFLKR